MGCDCGRSSTKEIKVRRINNNSSQTQIHNLDGSTFSSNNGSSQNNTKEKHLNLQDYMYTKINQFSLNLDVYYKNQRPPKNKSSPFIDDLFPHNDNSIFGLDSKGRPIDPIESRRTECSKYFKVKPGDAVWKRASEIFNNQPYSVFEGKVEASDSIQGGVGDCYFLSAISAIAEFPQMICQIFKTNTISPNGCYEIAFRLNGEWKIVIVDDYFPCSKSTSLPLFCKPNGNEIWTMLLEKAWAKVNGGYINIDAGFTIEVLSTLTPFPTDIIYHSELSPEESWRTISESDKQDHILTCITKFDDNIEHYGLISGHSCTLVSAFERKVKGKKVKLLKIRNPWGYKEWSGRYSDGSPEWDEDTIKCFGDVKVKEDGIFWMEFEDYLKFFEETEICKAKRSICVKNIKINKDRICEPNIFHLSIFQKTNVDITLLRKTYRFNRKIIPNEDIIANLLLVKINKIGKVITLLKTSSSSRKNSTLSETLEKGEYLIYFFVDYSHGKFDKKRKYSIDVACDQYFGLYDKGTDQNFYFLKKIIESKIENKGKTAERTCHHIIEECSSGFEDSTFGFLYLKNISEKPHRIHIMPKLTNLYLMEDKYQTKQADINNIDFILLKNDVFILLANTIDFYKDTEMSFDYEKYHSKDKNSTLSYQKKNSVLSSTINKFFSKITCAPEHFYLHKFTSYSFIYNRIKFEYNDIIQQIDHKRLAQETMLERYPEDMKELLKLKPLQDNEDVIFRDRYYIGEDYYFGEQHYVSMVRHGRGKYCWHDGLVFIGYSTKGQFNGKGKLIYPNGEVHEGNFVNGNLIGKGRIYKGGRYKEVVFPI